ncbi:MAG: hypothetical protein NVSMB1_09730 [Polyangiales bacterium]
MSLRRGIASLLERGAAGTPGRWEKLMGDESFIRLSRPLRLPQTAKVVGVGGATIGGSGRTPLAITVADALASRGVRVAVVGHAYGAHPRYARVVRGDDGMSTVGDEAMLAAQCLSPRVPVVVAPSRQEAVSLAAEMADTIVVDRLFQTHPAPLAYSVLSVEAGAPWGSGRLVPWGDLLAPRAALISMSDEVVEMGGRDAKREFSAIIEAGVRRPLSALSGRRVGLITVVARPKRVLEMLDVQGIVPVKHLAFHDHGGSSPLPTSTLGAMTRKLRIDLWLVDPKSALHLPAENWGPVAMLDVRWHLSEALVQRIVDATSFGHRGP